ncbi:DUF6279 family lipoprotein [Piscinibacter koreensis]|uniref:DUF6279 family lipoprotein n=1 Tax=Piscinibacter koreensis TaxID=2742824 RepID=UPI001591CA7F
MLLGALVLLLAGCSALKLGYGQAPGFMFRWIDGYIAVNDAQELRTREALRDWFAWHRREQLPDYAELLARARRDVAGDTTPERVCALWRDVKGLIGPAVERAAPAVGEILVTLSPAQIAQIERRNVERNAEYRDEHMQADPVKRRRAAAKRAVKRAEMLYGDLDAGQRELVAKLLADSPYDVEQFYAERERRQQDALQTIRTLVATRATPADAAAAVKAYAQRAERSPREAYRRQAERVADYNCAFAATLHNRTTPAQRETAARKLKRSEDDLRALAGEPA